MVYTITLNPALDRNIWIEKLIPDDSNRIQKEERYAAGKGIDVSRVLTTLGVPSKALGFVGGFDGEELKGRLINEGISCNFTKIAAETRTNIVIYDIENESQTIFSAPGPEIEPFELVQIIGQIEKLGDAQIIVISGSLPPGVHPEVYREIIQIAKSKGSKIVVDTDGAALETIIMESPDIIKPNLHELRRLSGRELNDIDEILSTAQSMCDQGIGIVLVSLGARGILLVGEKERFLAVPPQIKVVNTIGAGDSAIAGFVFGVINGKPNQESLIYAVAAGTATTLSPGTATCTKTDFMEMKPRVKLFQGEEIKEAIPGL